MKMLLKKIFGWTAFIIVVGVFCFAFFYCMVYQGLYVEIIKPEFECRSICWDLDLEHVSTDSIWKECVCANDIVAKPWKVMALDVYERP